MGCTYGCRKTMTQEITVTKVEDHYEMQFGGGNSYPVPEHAIETLDEDLTPEKLGESVTFRGDYGGHKHMKTFDVEEVVDGLDDDDESDDDVEDATSQDEADDESEDTEFGRIETIGEKPGVDTATIRKGDVLRLVSGEPRNEGVRYRVVNNDHMGGFGGDSGALTVEAIDEEIGVLPRDTIVDNGSGPLFEPVEEA